MRGIVLIAGGNAAYGGWALNLAMGLKNEEPDIDITLLWHGNAKTYFEKNHSYIFNSIIEIPTELITRNGIINYVKAKTLLYDLSPYEETIFIDADVIWFPNKKITDLFDSLKDIDFTIGNRGKSELTENTQLTWSIGKDMLKYGDIVYNLSSEFIYFKKTKKVYDLFKLSQEVYDNIDIDYKRFDGGVPDELAFQIAMMIEKITPHKSPYLPFYWEAYEKKSLKIPQLYNGFWGYSIGGAGVSPMQKQIYDALVKHYSSNFGVKFPFLANSKRNLFKLRQKI